MRILNARAHGILDYVLVVVLVVTPFVAGLGGLVALLVFLLAALHLVVTLTTRFPVGAVGIIPFWVHGLIELLVAAFLVAAPFLIGFGPGSPARRAYVALAALIFLVWLLTDYGAPEGRERRSA